MRTDGDGDDDDDPYELREEWERVTDQQEAAPNVYEQADLNAEIVDDSFEGDEGYVDYCCPCQLRDALRKFPVDVDCFSNTLYVCGIIIPILILLLSMCLYMGLQKYDGPSLGAELLATGCRACDFLIPGVPVVL